jgi:hypothetical protein
MEILTLRQCSHPTAGFSDRCYVRTDRTVFPRAFLLPTPKTRTVGWSAVSPAAATASAASPATLGEEKKEEYNKSMSR